jgi:Uma2 family endonuclease
MAKVRAKRRRRRGRSRAEEAPIAQLFPPQGQWTEDDYFALPEVNRHLELSEGRLIMPPHPTFTHQTVVQQIFLKLNAFVEEKELGIVRFAPLPVRLWPGKIREPDVFFISSEHQDRLGERVCGVPDLAVEVISPGTRRVDRHEKPYEYAKAGVAEFWLVDPDAQTVEVYTLEEGAYELLGKFGPGETACSRLLKSFKLPVDELFEGKGAKT